VHRAPGQGTAGDVAGEDLRAALLAKEDAHLKAIGKAPASKARAPPPLPPPIDDDDDDDDDGPAVLIDPEDADDRVAAPSRGGLTSVAPGGGGGASVDEDEDEDEDDDEDDEEELMRELERIKKERAQEAAKRVSGVAPPGSPLGSRRLRPRPRAHRAPTPLSGLTRCARIVSLCVGLCLMVFRSVRPPMTRPLSATAPFCRPTRFLTLASSVRAAALAAASPSSGDGTMTWYSRTRRANRRRRRAASSTTRCATTFTNASSTSTSGERLPERLPPWPRRAAGGSFKSRPRTVSLELDVRGTGRTLVVRLTTVC
jgi:hypothetical protein